MGKLHKLVATTAVVATAAIGLSQIADADTYTVKSGDTLWDIAMNNGTTVDQLMKDNNLTSDLIFPGDKLTYERIVADVAQAKSNGTYTVVLGDTLGKLSGKFGLSVDKLVELNKIENPNLIYVGQVLKIAEGVETPVKETVKVTKSIVEDPKEETKVEETPKVEVKQETAVVEAPKTQVAPAPAVKQEAPKVETKAATPAPVVKPVQQEAPKVQVASSNKAATIYQAALAQVGRMQDCTMLVTNALRSVGINFHDWPAGYLSLGSVVPASQAIPGDLVYYRDGGLGLAHIAVYAGNGQAVHGGWLGNQTVVNSVNGGSGPVYIRVR